MTRSSSPFDEFFHFPCPTMSASSLTRQRTDISRLLDPSYSSYTPPTSAAYVDAHGDLHDPDYRHFPLIPPSRSPKRLSGGAASNSRFQNSRPHWELIDEDALLDDDDDLLLDDDDNTSFFQSRHHRRYSPTYNKPRIQYPASRRSSGATSPTRLGGLYSGYGTTSSTRGSAYYYPTTTLDISPPTSYDSSHDTVLSTSVASQSSPLEEKRGCLISSLKRKRRRSSTATAEKEKESRRSAELDASETQATSPLRRSFSSSRLGRMDEHDNDHIAVVEEDEEEEEQQQRDQEEWVPTCSESLKRQWQAISLRFRFGVFRAQRNLKRRVHSLM